MVIPLGFLAVAGAGVGVQYWLAALQSSNSETPYGVAVDTSGNVYICGNVQISNLRTVLAKYNASGVLQWQRSLDGANNIDIAYNVSVDSSGNAYITGRSDVSGVSQEILVAKYNTSGTLQWQKRLGGNQFDEGTSIKVTPSGVIYLVGTSQVSNNYGIQLAKYDTNGNLTWQRILNGSWRDGGYDIDIDSSENVYVSGYMEVVQDSQEAVVVAKYDSTGTIQWQRRLGGATSTTNLGRGVAVDSSGNVYVAGYSFVSSQAGLLAKYNSSGTLQWQKRYTGTSPNFEDVASDPSGNIYVCGNDSTTWYIGKFDTSGTTQWQRNVTISGNAFSKVARRITLDTNGAMYITGDMIPGGSDAMILAKLPVTGALTGTYSLGGYSYSYYDGGLSENTSSLADQSAGMSASSSSLTANDSTLDQVTISLTSTTTIIG